MCLLEDFVGFLGSKKPSEGILPFGPVGILALSFMRPVAFEIRLKIECVCVLGLAR